MKKHIKLFIVLGIILVGSFSFYLFEGYKKDALVYENNKIMPSSSGIAMMLETSAGSGNYEMTTRSEWPTEGYVFNANLSKCENGSELSWDNENKKVLMSGNKSDKCYVYFDVYVKQRFDQSCNDNTLACHTAKLYTGTQGANNIYYHDANLTNGAGDNSYRYAGADVKNYICLGSSEATCPDDNLYRIIGVFGDDNHGVSGQQLVKVIKNTSYGIYEWSTSNSSDWATASLKITLNSTFITEKLSGFEDKIAEVTWRVSGYSTSAATAKTVYTGEITNATKTYTAKIGLIYPSDYGYATTPDYWTTNVYDYNTAASSKDWLFLGSYEWLLSPGSGDFNGAWNVNSSGRAYNNGGVVYASAVRPSFYLLSSVKYVSGSGTSSLPIRIN